MDTIKHYSELEKFYAGTHPIAQDSPELLFIRAVCAGDDNAVMSLFSPQKLFGGALPVVDTPYERFEGLEAIGRFARGWNARFQAKASTATPCIQTIANGRVALEVSVSFHQEDGITQVPMFVIGDFRTRKTLDEVRIYFHFSMLPDLTPYRKPMFRAAHLEMGDPGLLTGAVREYYEALHHQPAVDVDKILGSMGERISMAGYKFYDPALPGYKLPCEEVREAFTRMQPYIPSGIIMRYETLIDDGRNCVIEWVHVVSRKGREEFNRISLSCIAAYERGEDGLLCAVRIMDYAGHELEIDWTKTPVSHQEAMQMNYIEKMIPGCGLKPQYDMA